jgi:hypothetical protein
MAAVRCCNVCDQLDDEIRYAYGLMEDAKSSGKIHEYTARKAEHRLLLDIREQAKLRRGNAAGQPHARRQ